MTEEQEKRRSLARFLDPSAWSNWPYQTIKRRLPDGGFPDCGLLVDFAPRGQPCDVRFVEAELFDLRDKARRADILDKARLEPAIDAAGLIADGWVID